MITTKHVCSVHKPIRSTGVQLITLHNADTCCMSISETPHERHLIIFHLRPPFDHTAPDSRSTLWSRSSVVNTVDGLRLSLQMRRSFALPEDPKAKSKQPFSDRDTKSIESNIMSRLDVRPSIWSYDRLQSHSESRADRIGYLHFPKRTRHLDEQTDPARVHIQGQLRSRRGQEIKQTTIIESHISNKAVWCFVNSVPATGGATDISDGTYVKPPPKHPASQIFMIYVCGGGTKRESKRGDMFVDFINNWTWKGYI